MHRVNFKKRQKLVLRIVSYGIITILTVLTTALLLYAALGYRITRKGDVVRSGLLLVESKPVAADVFINGEDKNDRTNSRFVLPSGSYELSLRAEGFREWRKTVALEPSSVENIFYPFLLPKQINYDAVAQISDVSQLSQSPDRKTALLLVKNAPQMQLLELSEDTSTLRSLNVPATFLINQNSLGELNVVEWSLDSKKVLLFQKADAASRLLLIDVRSPEKSVDLAARFPRFELSNSRLATDNGNVLYSLQAGVLRKFTVSSSEAVSVANNVEAYAPLNDKTVAFVRKNAKNNQFELVFRSGDKETIIHRSPLAKGTHRLEVSEYDGGLYVSATLAGEKSVRIFKNPLSEPILDEQLPYTVLKNQAGKISKSPNGQFVLTQNGNKFTVHDFEYARSYSFTVDATSLAWASNHHLLFEDSSKKTFVMEFDGANRYELSSSVRSLPMFSDGMRALYHLKQEKAGLSLQYADITKP